MFDRTVEPQYREMRKTFSRRFQREGLPKVRNCQRSWALELVELTIEVEESGVEPAVDIKTVRDFLWLCRAMDFQRQRKSDQSPI
jgi:hypothetical protein